MLPARRNKIDISVSLISSCVPNLTSSRSFAFPEIVSAGAAAVFQVWKGSDAQEHSHAKGSCESALPELTCRRVSHTY